MDPRKGFDTIPEEFDKWRPRYCDAAFQDIISHSQLGPGKSALEIGPGTGQATEPVLKTGCEYLAIELGAHLAAYTANKFKSYNNLHIVNADFETHNFQQQQFDLVYSAAAMQWIPETIGFGKTYNLLRRGGTFAMMFLRADFQTPNKVLYEKIQSVYRKYFFPELPYTQKLNYENVTHYGFVDLQCRQYQHQRVYTADEYTALIATYSDHISLREPYRSSFFAGIRNAIVEAGNRITLNDTIVLYLTRKP